MKRGGPLKRTPIRRSSKGLKRGGPLRRRRRKRPPEGPLTPGEWRGTAIRQATWLDTYPRDETGRRVPESQVDVHHVLDKGELRARRLYHVVWDPRNALVVLAGAHQLHTHSGGPHRIPRHLIRRETWEFARELGPWAVAWIERHHPETTTPRRSQ